MDDKKMQGPKLTISDDLQIVPGTARYFSKSRCTLDATIQTVSEWLESNPLHSRIAEAREWLQKAEEKTFQDGLRRVAESRRLERKALEILVRREVHNYLWRQKVKFADLPGKTDELTEGFLKEFGY